MKRLKRPAIRTHLYQNCRVYGPDGELMFRCNRRRLDWYLARDLALEKGENAIQLLFEPKGPGAAGDRYYLEDRDNVCVVCGAVEQLTRHHVVPDSYRRHFPGGITAHNWFDVLLLCISCHEEYEQRALDLRQQIADEHGVALNGLAPPVDNEALRAVKFASALKRHWPTIPEPRREVLLDELRRYLKKDIITEQDILATSELDSRTGRGIPAGKIIVEQTSNLDVFVRRWREHFIATMQPRFLSRHWVVNRTADGRGFECAG
jgi:hypothetical protein